MAGQYPLDAEIAKRMREIIADEVTLLIRRDRLFKNAWHEGSTIYVEWGAYKDLIKLEVIGPGSEA